MAVKIQYRRGNAAAVPNLDIGEPGWDIDVKTGRIGDGTASPPRVMTTKSSGSFDYSSVTDIRVARMILGLGSTAAASLYFNASDADTGMWSPGAGQLAMSINGTTRFLLDTTGLDVTGDIAPTGNVDGVKISKLNPAGIHGVLVKTANNEYAIRNLVNGVGMAAFKNAAGANNPGGVVGDIIVQIADNATLPGTAAVKIPAGTTGERGGVSPINGHLRYNSSKKSFEGYIDGEWRELVDYVEGKVVQIPSQFPSIQDAIDYFNNRSTKSIVYAQLATGAHPVPAALSPSSRTNRVLIQGAAPQDIKLDTNSGTPIVAVSGAAGNWQITYKLDAPLPDWLTVGPTGHSVIIADVEASGDMPMYLFDANKGMGIPEANKAQIVMPAAKDANGAVIPISAYYQVNDYVMTRSYRGPLDVKRISSIVSTSVAGVNSAFADFHPGTGNRHRRFRKIAGTLACTNSTTVTGTGTVFTQQLNVGDHLILLGTLQVIRVSQIVSDSQLIVDMTTTIAAGVGFTGHNNNEAIQFVTSTAHLGCFSVTAKNAVDRTITVTNTSQALIPPPIKGIRRGTIKFMPSTVLFTSSRFFNVADNEFLGLKNLTVRYTGGSPTAANYGIAANNGYLTTDTVGFVNAPISISRNSSLAFTGVLAVSGVQSTANCIAVQLSSSMDGTDLICSGGKGGGLFLRGSVVNANRIVTAGNGGVGLASSGNSQAQATQHKSTWNRYNGIRIDSMDKCNFSTSDYIYNGVFSPVGLGQGGLVSNIQVFSGSGFAAGECSLILSGNSQGALVQQSSWASLSYSLIGNHKSENVRAHLCSQVYLAGAHLRNTDGSNLVATFQSMICADSRGLSVDYGKVHGAVAQHNSFLVLIRTTTAYGSFGFVKRGPLSSTKNYDIIANYRSSAYVSAIKGSLAQNQLAISPLINGAEASFGSVAYGTLPPNV